MKIPFLVQSASAQAGSSKVQWTSIGTLWGKIEAIGEALPYPNSSRRVTHKVTARYRPDLEVKTGMRLLLNDRVFLIREVRNVDEADRLLRLLVEEGDFLN